MSFRPFNLEICRASLAGALFFMCVVVSWAGDSQSQSAEISLSRTGISDTGTNQAQRPESPFSQFFLPHAPNSFQITPNNRPVALPPPGPQMSLQQTEREKELLDRRRNWVFMTPEEMMGTDDSEKDSPDGKSDKDHDPQKPSTVMERYYQRLFDSDQQQSTNRASNKFDADTWTKSDDNPFAIGDAQQTGDQPKSAPNMGVFQSMRGDAFPDIFHIGPRGGVAAGAVNLSPEQVRVKAEQEAHMQSFKQLWDIDQPAKDDTTASVISTPTPSVHVSSDSPFSSLGSQQSTFNASTPLNGGFSPTMTAPSEPQTISSLRAHSSPPHATFKPTSSPF